MDPHAARCRLRDGPRALKPLSTAGSALRWLTQPSLLRRLLFGQLLLLAGLWWLLVAVSAAQRVSDETLRAEVAGLRAIAVAAAALLDRPVALQAALEELERERAAGVSAGAEGAEAQLRTYTVVHHGERLLFASPGLAAVVLGPHPLGISDLEDARTGASPTRWRIVTEGVTAADGQLLRVSELVPEGPLLLLLSLNQHGGLVLPLLFSMPLLLVPALLSLHGALRPWRQLAAGLAARDSQDLRPVPLPGHQRELRPLVDAINAWLGQIRELREREQRFLADAAHELRTPLAAVQLATQHLQSALGRGDAVQADAALQAVLRGSTRSARLSHQLLALLRAEADAGTPAQRIDLAAWLPEQVADLAPLARQRGVELALSIADARRPHPVQVQADGLQSLLVNLVDNAVRHAPRASTVELTLLHRGTHLLLQVDDAGPGVPAEQREVLLQRFRRGPGQPSGSGSGLGLAIVASVVQRHQGRLRLERAPTGGLRVEVELPAAAA